MVILAAFFGGAIANRGHDQQADFAFFGTALPVDLSQFLVTHLAIASAVENDGLLPACFGIAPPHLFGGELGLAIKAAPLAGSSSAQDNVFAAAHDQAHVLPCPILLQYGAVA